MNISSLMNTTAVHKTKTRTPDNQGGYIYAFTTAETYVARLSQPSAGVRLNQDMGKDTGHVTHELYISPVPDAGTFSINDQIVIDSRTFEIKIPNISPSIPVYQKLALMELQS